MQLATDNRISFLLNETDSMTLLMPLWPALIGYFYRLLIGSNDVRKGFLVDCDVYLSRNPNQWALKFSLDGHVQEGNMV